MSDKGLLQDEIEHLDLDVFDPVPLVDAMEKMAFQARNTARAAKIFERMLRDEDCSIILCLAGSLVSAGLKKVILQMVENHMVDAIVSTGANIVDQDFFEGLGFRHYIGTPFIDDNELRAAAIDRIYDTFIDEDELRICDETMTLICNRLEPRPHSSPGDRIAAENYLQHAEHYIRIVAQNQAATLERQQQQERERTERAGQRRPRRGDGEDQPDEIAEAGDVEATVETGTAKDAAEGPAGDDSEDRAA